MLGRAIVEIKLTRDQTESEQSNRRLSPFYDLVSMFMTVYC